MSFQIAGINHFEKLPTDVQEQIFELLTCEVKNQLCATNRNFRNMCQEPRFLIDCKSDTWQTVVHTCAPFKSRDGVVRDKAVAEITDNFPDSVMRFITKVECENIFLLPGINFYTIDHSNHVEYTFDDQQKSPVAAFLECLEQSLAWMDAEDMPKGLEQPLKENLDMIFTDAFLVNVADMLKELGVITPKRLFKLWKTNGVLHEIKLTVTYVRK